MSPIPFYFDFISPYAYIAWTLFGREIRRHGREIQPMPVLFAGLLNAHGQKGPAEIPAKREYVFRNAMRIAHRHSIPLKVPDSHPFNPLWALRLASLESLSSDSRLELIAALYAATWADSRAVGRRDVVGEVLTALGLDVGLLDEAEAPRNKARLRETTDAAIARGVFGVPTIDVDGELFWGVDALEDIRDRLAGRDPVKGLDLTDWDALGATATR